MSSLDFASVKGFDVSTQRLVFGFVRELSGQDMPDLVVHAIMVFYYQTERFTRHNPDKIQVCKDGMTVTKICDTSTSWGNTTYGRQKIDYDGQGVHEWRLKMVQMNQGICMIGIDAGNNLDTTFHQQKEIKWPYFGYNGFSGKVWDGSQYKGTHPVGGSKYATGDTVRVEVVMNRKVIGFAVNDDAIKRHFPIGNTERPYHLAVSMYAKGASMTLLSYVWRKT